MSVMGPGHFLYTKHLLFGRSVFAVNYKILLVMLALNRSDCDAAVLRVEVCRSLMRLVAVALEPAETRSL